MLAIGGRFIAVIFIDVSLGDDVGKDALGVSADGLNAMSNFQVGIAPAPTRDCAWDWISEASCAADAKVWVNCGHMVVKRNVESARPYEGAIIWDTKVR